MKIGVRVSLGEARSHKYFVLVIFRGGSVICYLTVLRTFVDTGRDPSTILEPLSTFQNYSPLCTVEG